MTERELQIQLGIEIQKAIEEYEEASGFFVADVRLHRTGPILIGVGLLTTVNKEWKVEPELQQS